MTSGAIVLFGLYALLMGVLSVYAAHAYLMLYLYRRHKADVPRAVPPPSVWPRVTVQLPIYNEQYVVRRLLEAVCALDYPRDQLEIQILDDSTDATREMAQALAHAYRAQGLDIAHLPRANREGFKAGALRAGLATARGDYIAIFDADFVPPRDFLTRLIPHFTHDRIGMVQARWGHLNDSYSLLARGQAMGLDAHFVLEHGARNAAGLFINFNGTAGIWRKTAILDAGNWQDDTLTEDMDLSYRAQLAGWRFVYVNDVVCPAEIPADVYGFKQQQYRWAKGAIQTARKLLPTVWRRPELSRLVKFEATVHLTNHLVFPILLLIALLTYPILALCLRGQVAQPFVLCLSAFTVSFLSYPLFYAFAQRELYPDWKRRLLFLPVVMAGAIGLCVINTRAIFSALMGRRSAFTRTPKYNLTNAGAASWQGAHYRSRLTLTAWLEVALAVYLSYVLAFGIQTLQFASVFFMLLYWFGFTFISTLSFAHAVRR